MHSRADHCLRQEVHRFIVCQELKQCHELSRCLELVALQSCLQFIAFVKGFILGQQPNRC